MKLRTLSAASCVCKRLGALLLLLLLVSSAFAQRVVSTSGKDAENATGSVSFSFGEPAVMVLSPERMSNEGVQQPYRDDSNTYERTVCQHHPYSDDAFSITATQNAEAGTYVYRDTLLNANRFGGDSIIVLHLTVFPAVELVLSESQNVNCFGDATGSLTLSTTGGTAGFLYSLNGGDAQEEPLFDALTAGDYKVVVTDANGCKDSLEHSVTQPEEALSVSATAMPEVLCVGDSAVLTASAGGGTSGYTYAWTASPAGSGLPTDVARANLKVGPEDTTTYTITVTDAKGCSETATATVMVNQHSAKIDTQNPCDSLRWIDGNLYTADNNTATKTFTRANSVGCDSVVTLNLTLRYSNTGDTEAVACDHFKWYENPEHKVHATAETFSEQHTFVNAEGCDSVVTLDLTINANDTSIDIQNVCDSLRWIDGNLYTADNNTASYKYTNIVNCDSVVLLNLTIRHSTTKTDAQNPCDSLRWIDGNLYTSDNTTATDTLVNAVNCDSVITLNLTVRYSSAKIDEQEVCDSLRWIDDELYLENNSTATKKLTNGAGCDSVVNLHLTVKHSSDGDTVAEACNQFKWYNNPLHMVTDSKRSFTETHTFTNSQGCDSVVTLRLTVYPNTSGTDVKDVCDSLRWIDGLLYTAANTTATHKIENVAGCDSTVTLNLTVRYSNTGIDEKNPCDSLRWIDGKLYVADTNTATHKLTNVENCDSVVTLHLALRHSTAANDTHQACNTYTWIDGTIYNESTTSATYKLNNEAGCDSVVTLILTLGHDNDGVDVQVACDSFLWIDDVKYTESNHTTTHTLPNANKEHCDSVVTLDLTIGYANTGDDYQSACNTFTWIDGSTYSASIDEATATLANIWGCDSVVTLHLTLGHDNTGIDEQSACDTFTWIDGVTYTASNSTATQTVTNVSGCDSVVTLHLTISYADTSHNTATLCAGETYSQLGFNTPTTVRTAPQLVFDSVRTQTVMGCDSLSTLIITVNPVDSNIQTATINGGLTFNNLGFNIATEIRGTDYEVLDTNKATNLYGCDSTVFLTLTVLGTDSAAIDTTVCENVLPIEWRGVTFSEAGLQTTTIHDAVEGDKVFSLLLKVNAVSTSDTYAVACDSYDWYENLGLTTTSTATHTFEGANALGCDSVVTLHLTVKKSSSSQFIRHACDSYTWIDGIVYLEPNDTAVHVLKGANSVGCDSVIHLHLSMDYHQWVYDTQTICFSQLPYTWHGIEFDRAGSRTITDLVSKARCDSNITMTLYVKTSYTKSDERTICPSELPYTWNGVEFTQMGLDTIVLPTIDGCDSTVIMNLKVNNSHHSTLRDTACYEYLWEIADASFPYATPGLDTHIYIHQLDNGCEAIDSLILLIHPNKGKGFHQTACDRYTWSRSGVTYTVDTTALYPFIDDNDCATADTLYLNIDNNTNLHHAETGCDTFFWIHTDTDIDTLTVEGTYSYFYYSPAGCPSYDTIDLTLVSGSHDAYDVPACDQFFWASNGVNGHGSDTLITASGDYVSHYLNDSRCHSADTLHLTLYASGSGTDTVRACDRYEWVVLDRLVNVYTAPGLYTTVSEALNGCERHDTLLLMIGHSSSATDYRVMCDSLEWIDGIVYDEPVQGVTHTLTNADGCDSVVTLSLSLSYATSSTEIINACESYFWNDSTYTASTEDRRVFTNRFGCDSIAYFRLTINKTENSIDHRFACDSLVWHNTVYYASTNTPKTRLFNRFGCDSVVTLDLTIRHASTSTISVQGEGSYIYNGNTYLYSGEYTEILTNSIGCDSVVVLSVSLIHNKPLPQIQAYQNKAVMVNHYPNGQDHPRVDYIAYRWYHNGQFISGSPDDYYARKGYAPLSGSYYVEVPTDESRTHWVRSNTIEIAASKTEISLADGRRLMLYPNPVRSGGMVTLVLANDEKELLDGSRVVVYDLLGRMVFEAEVADVSLTFKADFPTGAYSVVYSVPGRDLSSVKLIVK